MYITRALLLLLGLALVFLPVILEWAFAGGTAWYRPYLLWLLVILAAYWNQRSKVPDEL
ncbi:MAG: hypothetical protein ABJK20_07945 [Halieaceae bacterium]